MKAAMRIALICIVLALFATGCTDPKAEERAQSDRIQMEAKCRYESIRRSAGHSEMSDKEYEQLRKEVAGKC